MQSACNQHAIIAITGARLAWCPVRTCDRERPFEAIYRNQRGPQSQSERSSDAIREVLRRNQRPSFEFLVRLHADRTSSTDRAACNRTSSTDRAACLPAARTSRCLASFSMSFDTCDEGGNSRPFEDISCNQRPSTRFSMGFVTAVRVRIAPLIDSRS